MTGPRHADRPEHTLHTRINWKLLPAFNTKVYKVGFRN